MLLRCTQFENVVAVIAANCQQCELHRYVDDNYNVCIFIAERPMKHIIKAKQKNVFGSSNPTDPFFLMPTLAFFIRF